MCRLIKYIDLIAFKPLIFISDANSEALKIQKREFPENHLIKFIVHRAHPILRYCCPKAFFPNDFCLGQPRGCLVIVWDSMTAAKSPELRKPGFFMFRCDFSGRKSLALV